MSFRPFGRRIEFTAPVPRAECIRRLRGRVVPSGERHMDVRPRGMLVGSVGLFWLHALDLIDRQSRPKLLVRLIDQGATTRISGRLLPGVTGAIGVLVGTPMILIMVTGLLLFQPAHRIADPAGFILAKILLAIATLSILGAFWWLLGRSERDGRPLESFMRRVLDAPPAPRA